MNDNDKKVAFANYHIKQSLGQIVTSLAFMIVGMVPILGWLISFLGSLFLPVLWVIGLVNAINLREKPVPLLGRYFKEWLRNINSERTRRRGVRAGIPDSAKRDGNFPYCQQGFIEFYYGKI